MLIRWTINFYHIFSIDQHQFSFKMDSSVSMNSLNDEWETLNNEYQRLEV